MSYSIQSASRPFAEGILLRRFWSSGDLTGYQTAAAGEAVRKIIDEAVDLKDEQSWDCRIKGDGILRLRSFLHQRSERGQSPSCEKV